MVNNNNKFNNFDNDTSTCTMLCEDGENIVMRITARIIDTGRQQSNNSRRKTGDFKIAMLLLYLIKINF